MVSSYWIPQGYKALLLIVLGETFPISFNFNQVEGNK